MHSIVIGSLYFWHLEIKDSKRLEKLKRQFITMPDIWELLWSSAVSNSERTKCCHVLQRSESRAFLKPLGSPGETTQQGGTQSCWLWIWIFISSHLTPNIYKIMSFYLLQQTELHVQATDFIWEDSKICMTFVITAREFFLNIYRVLFVDHLFVLFVIKLWKRMKTSSELLRILLRMSIVVVVLLCAYA